LENSETSCGTKSLVVIHCACARGLFASSGVGEYYPRFHRRHRRHIQGIGRPSAPPPGPKSKTSAGRTPAGGVGVEAREQAWRVARAGRVGRVGHEVLTENLERKGVGSGAPPDMLMWGCTSRPHCHVVHVEHGRGRPVGYWGKKLQLDVEVIHDHETQVGLAGGRAQQGSKWGHERREAVWLFGEFLFRGSVNGIVEQKARCEQGLGESKV
jgi:hypothetical protein